MSESVRSKNGSAATIVDVAKHAGVSIKTVSRVINREQSVRENTRAKVLRSIERLGYKRNLFARSLRSEKAYAFGLLYENPQGDYSADILHGALGCCQEHGYHLVVEILSSKDLPGQITRFLAGARVDGVFLTPPVCDDENVIELLEAQEIPFVRISPLRPRKGEAYIAIDDYSAAKEIVSYLASLGHHRIGHIMGSPGHAATEARLAGYKQALTDAQLDDSPDLIVSGSFEFESGRAAAEKLFAMENPPTAIFAANDEVAAGVLAFAHVAGIRVPEDVSVCGFDGGTVSEVVWPKLTTVNQSVRDLGEGAIKLLIDLTSENDEPVDPVLLPYSLKEGDSVASCAGAK